MVSRKYGMSACLEHHIAGKGRANIAAVNKERETPEQKISMIS